MSAPKTVDPALVAARDAYERNAWGEAYARLAAEDARTPLDAADLERMAITAYLIGRPDESTAAGARAHLEAVRTGDNGLALRACYGLGMTFIQRGDMGQGSGWLARGARLIEETGYEGAEPGFLLIPQGLQALMAGQPADALGIFERVAVIAERFDDADLKTMSRLGRGQSLIALLEIERGVALLDEAMTAVIAGEISPIASGIVYCAVIEVCQSMFDLRRAQEWTAALERWWASQPDMVPFRGNCLVYRAELMRLHGAWGEATEEALKAREWLSRPPPEPAVAEAIYELAELDRLRGSFAAAEAGYREASTWGRLPEPGLALLQLARGDVKAATASIRRAMAEATDEMVRARMLEPAAEIAVAAGDLDAARDAADRLGELADSLGAPLLRAMAARTEGSVRLAEGDVTGSLALFRRAWEAWRELDAPYEAARVRARTAEACRRLGDLEGAALETEAAREVFERLQAVVDLAALGAGHGSGSLPGGLSPREAEVVRLIAAGMTNRAIAAALTISERTVDRHVSNIYTKLDVSTRTAATAFAYEHGLV
jgi:DNA-binding CsgD family transcriptional regulator